MEQFDKDCLGDEPDKAETQREEQHEEAVFPGLRFLAHLPDDEQHPDDKSANADGEGPGFELFDRHDAPLWSQKTARIIAGAGTSCK